MNDAGDDMRDIDLRLARLPAWTPPPDFAARLAAAAARQAEAAPHVTPAPSRGLALLAWLTDLGPVAVGAALFAAALALVPWTELAGQALFPWAVALGTAGVGIAFTLRVLRAP
jgi:hypothetical protein